MLLRCRGCCCRCCRCCGGGVNDRSCRRSGRRAATTPTVFHTAAPGHGGVAVVSSRFHGGVAVMPSRFPCLVPTLGATSAACGVRGGRGVGRGRTRTTTDRKTVAATTPTVPQQGLQVLCKGRLVARGCHRCSGSSSRSSLSGKRRRQHWVAVVQQPAPSCGEIGHGRPSAPSVSPAVSPALHIGMMGRSRAALGLGVSSGGCGGGVGPSCWCAVVEDQRRWGTSGGGGGWHICRSPRPEHARFELCLVGDGSVALLHQERCRKGQNTDQNTGQRAEHNTERGEDEEGS